MERTDRVDIRVSAEEGATFRTAAKMAGKSLSEWARDVMMAAAKRDEQPPEERSSSRDRKPFWQQDD